VASSASTTTRLGYGRVMIDVGRAVALSGIVVAYYRPAKANALIPHKDRFVEDNGNRFCSVRIRRELRVLLDSFVLPDHRLMVW
jgi:hypothetical protein